MYINSLTLEYIVVNMYVYRIENHQGQGPYQNLDWMDEVGCPQPMPHKDIQGWDDMSSEEQAKFKFGFLYLGDLHKWFSKTELLKLADLGYYIERYIVPEKDIVLSQGIQVAFRHIRSKKCNLISYEF